MIIIYGTKIEAISLTINLLITFIAVIKYVHLFFCSVVYKAQTICQTYVHVFWLCRLQSTNYLSKLRSLNFLSQWTCGGIMLMFSISVFFLLLFFSLSLSFGIEDWFSKSHIQVWQCFGRGSRDMPKNCSEYRCFIGSNVYSCRLGDGNNL